MARGAKRPLPRRLWSRRLMVALKNAWERRQEQRREASEG